MRALLLFLIFLLVVAGCDSRHSAATPREWGDREYGEYIVQPGAPFCCIYVGLDGSTNDSAMFDAAFWHFADQHAMRKPSKHYMTYSGPLFATCQSDHVAVFAGTTDTTSLAEHRKQFGVPAGIPVDWRIGMWQDAYWPTNASRITKDSGDLLAPYTGSVRMAPTGSKFPLQDFKRLTEDFRAAMQSVFPDRVVCVFSYDGVTK
jgi:hypothetical protein